MALKLDGRNPLAYMGVRPVTPPQLVVQYRQPTANDIQNFSLGTMWVIPNQNSGPTEEVWVLVDMAANVATWAQIFPQATPGGAVDSLTGDSGGAVGPDVGGNINILGTAGNVTVTGNPGTNTLTINIAGEVATTFDTDAGTATPNLGIINIIGGTNISTSGAGNTITIDSNDAVAEQFTTDAGVAVPSGGNLDVLGGANVDTSGAGDAITIAVPLTITADSSTAGFTNGAMNVLGGACTTTSGNGTTTLTVGLSSNAGDGKIPIGRAAGATAFANITSLDGSIVVTNGTNSIDISSSGGAGGTAPFFAYNNAQAIDYFTGFGTPVIVRFNATLFNVGSNYDTASYVWTCPSTGYYYFNFCASVLAPLSGGLTPGYLGSISLVTTTNTYYFGKEFSGGLGFVGYPAESFNGSIFCYMSVGETAAVYFVIPNQTIGYHYSLNGSTPPSQLLTFFSGYRVA